MTPKEKAKELFNKYWYELQDVEFSINRAKQCALIAVDEVLELRRGYFDCMNYMNNESYWEQVKQEINKL